MRCGLSEIIATFVYAYALCRVGMEGKYTKNNITDEKNPVTVHGGHVFGRNGRGCRR